MSIDVTVKSTEPMTVASLSMKGPFSLMGEAFGKLFGWIGASGYVPAGPPGGVYHNDPCEVPAEELLWEIFCPIGGDASPIGPDDQGLSVKRIESSEVASAVHKGPFVTVSATYEALAGWVTENGYEITGAPQEVYLTDPSNTAPEELLTEVRIPVRKR